MHARTLKKLARTLLIVLLVCLSIAPTALADGQEKQGPQENFTIRIKTVDTALKREPSVIDIYQGQYVDSGKYQLYKDEDLSEPVYFTKLHAHYTVCPEDTPDATKDMVCNLGILSIEGLSEQTYWLAQTDPPDERRTLAEPMELTLTHDPEARISLDEARNPIAETENGGTLVIDYDANQTDAFAQTMLIILAILLIIIIIVIVYIFTKNYDGKESNEADKP